VQFPRASCAPRFRHIYAHERRKRREVVCSSSPVCSTTHALDGAHFPESVILVDFTRGYRRAAWNFSLTAGSFGPCGPEWALGLWRRFFSFRGRREGVGRDRSSKRLRVVRNEVG
jgi:hypothetical protein